MDIGTEEYLESDNFCLIEWGERIAPLLPPHTQVTSVLMKIYQELLI